MTSQRVYRARLAEGYQWIRPLDLSDRRRIVGLGVQRHRATWTPMHMEVIDQFEGRTLLPSTLVAGTANTPTFHPFLVETLSLDLDSYGESLPVWTESGTYVLFHATTLTDAVDWANTEADIFPSSGRLMAIRSLALDRERIPDRPFQIAGFERGAILLPATFVALLQGLSTGMRFTCVWPERGEV